MDIHAPDARSQAWVFAPFFIGVILHISGIPGSLAIGLFVTVVGVALSCALMAAETRGPLSGIITFPAVLALVACGAVLGSAIMSRQGDEDTTSNGPPIQDKSPT